MPIYSLGEKKPQLPENNLYWVAPDAHVIGNVILGKDVGVWFGSVLRGDNDVIKIGEETNIQENTIIHVDPDCPVTIGNNCTIGHNAIIHGCKLHDNVLIGMGSILMDNCVIHSNSIIAAGAVLTQNTIVPPGSIFAGIPAKKINEIDQNLQKDEVERIAESYLLYSSWYKK